ncbi:hypothetical protein OIHEL45_19661 [Sulfitobacter indolifex HEL-45]|uniref:Uncharacterized protein n=1 Tax=Sulfitobacter indolifex HEL-45 TaxID=391624 RepID=A0ABP2D4N7_9RHOB|nr:hypothetical protein OIHEL45_19661 [Sulfitobacter indolifex HEL-45]
MRNGRADDGTFMPSLLPTSAIIRVNNELRNTPLEPKMTRYWKSDLILMIGYSSIAAVLVFAVL